MRNPSILVAERLQQHVLRRVLQAPRPVEPQAAGLVPSRRSEGGRDLRPPVGVFLTDLELRRNKDHQSSMSDRPAPRTSPRPNITAPEHHRHCPPEPHPRPSHCATGNMWQEIYEG